MKHTLLLSSFALALLPAQAQKPQHTANTPQNTAPSADQNQASGQNHARLGALVTPLPAETAELYQLPEGSGVVVQQVMADSTAQQMGLQEQDILIVANSQIIQSPQQLAQLIQDSHEQGVVINLVRDNQLLTLNSKQTNPAEAAGAQNLDFLPEEMQAIAQMLQQLDQAEGQQIIDQILTLANQSAQDMGLDTQVEQAIDALNGLMDIARQLGNESSRQNQDSTEVELEVTPTDSNSVE